MIVADEGETKNVAMYLSRLICVCLCKSAAENFRIDPKNPEPVTLLVQFFRVNDCPPPWRITPVAWGEDMQPHRRGSVGGFPPHFSFI